MKQIITLVVVLFQALLWSQESFVIKDVTLFDGERIIPKISVLIEDGKIVHIDANIKGDYTIIDGKGKFLMPAMTNSHVHTWVPIQLQEAAKAGVLNLLDMHGLEPMQGLMKNLRKSPGNARLYVAGYAATAPGGHGTQYGFPVPTLEGPADAEQWVTDRVKAGVDHIKIIVEPWKNTISHETAKAIITHAHAAQKVAVVHISKEEDAYTVLRNGADGLVHIWTDTTMPDAHLNELTKNHDFFVIPTVLTNVLVQTAYFGKTQEEADAVALRLQREVKRLYDAGIPILAGTDPPNANINIGTDLYKELAYLAKAGIPAIDVLRSATSLPADKFKLGKVGYIKEGYLADMILLEKSPVEDISHLNTIKFIWKEGRLIEK